MKNIDDEIQSTQRQIEQLTHRQDRLVSKLKVEERKKRTRWLIQRGAILESVIDSATDFTNEQIQTLLIDIFSTEFARAKVEELRQSMEDGENPLS